MASAVKTIADAILALKERHPEQKLDHVPDKPTQLYELPDDMQKEVCSHMDLQFLIWVYLITGGKDSDVLEFIRNELNKKPMNERYAILGCVQDITTFPASVAKDVLVYDDDEQWNGYISLYFQLNYKTMSDSQLQFFADKLRAAGILFLDMVTNMLHDSMHVNTNPRFLRRVFFGSSQRIFRDEPDDWLRFLYVLGVDNRPSSAQHDRIYTEVWSMARKCMPEASSEWLRDPYREYDRLRLLKSTGYMFGEQYYTEMCESVGRPSGVIREVSLSVLRWYFYDPEAIEDRLKKEGIIADDGVFAAGLSVDIASYIIITFLTLRKNEAYAKQALAQITDYSGILRLRDLLGLIIRDDKTDEVLPVVQFVAENSDAVHDRHPEKTNAQRVGHILIDSF